MNMCLEDKNGMMIDVVKVLILMSLFCAILMMVGIYLMWMNIHMKLGIKPC